MHLLVTNNELAFRAYQNKIKVDFLENGTYLDVLVKVRDYIQKGFRLETHPLAGSIKPNQTPYRSVLLSDEKSSAEELCEFELMIEDAVLMTRQFLKAKPLPEWEEALKRDFMEVDLDLIGGAIHMHV